MQTLPWAYFSTYAHTHTHTQTLFQYNNPVEKLFFFEYLEKEITVHICITTHILYEDVLFCQNKNSLEPNSTNNANTIATKQNPFVERQSWTQQTTTRTWKWAAQSKIISYLTYAFQNVSLSSIAFEKFDLGKKNRSSIYKFPILSWKKGIT